MRHFLKSLHRVTVMRCIASLILLGLTFDQAVLAAIAPPEAVSPKPLVAPRSSDRIESLSEHVDQLIEPHRGEVSLAVVNLDTGESLFRNADRPMPTASLIKLAVLIEAYRQDRADKISLNEFVVLDEEDKVPGSGILTPHFTAGTKISLRDAVRLMIVYSDNTATNLVLDTVGLENVNRTMERLGCPDTKMHAKVFRGDTSIAPERSKQFGLGSITARQAVSLLGRIHRKELFDDQACTNMLSDLTACEDKLKVRRHLPPGTKWAHKTGSVNAVRTDAGLLETSSGTIALCILTANNEDTSWSDENAGDLLCSNVGRVIYDAFSSSRTPDDIIQTPTQLALGANSDLVSALQRTLNAVMIPSPELSIDGDFGAVTRAAVERFQRENSLEVTGIVNQATWKALGPLITEAEPVGSPEEIALEASKLPLAEPDNPNAPPFVTCSAWAIGNAKTGEILWSGNGDDPRDMASTTKIMCALVVLDLAVKDPTVLDEIVTFSARADRTVGSTADVRAGEQVPVRELLYGLLLPSGNDAAQAFAEHFGPRLDPPTNQHQDANPSDPAENFIAEMNRTAARLGLKSSQFRNPHGLTAEGHHTSPNDLVRLAVAALKHELFRTVISTRLHGCTVTSESGYTRNCRWENTNKLLGIVGYSGVKTGTTRVAGACLVSLSNSPMTEQNDANDQQLIAVVLGSTSSDARYTDTRNLFRWAWSQMASRSQQAPVSE